MVFSLNTPPWLSYYTVFFTKSVWFSMFDLLSLTPLDHKYPLANPPHRSFDGLEVCMGRNFKKLLDGLNIQKSCYEIQKAINV